MEFYPRIYEILRKQGFGVMDSHNIILRASRKNAKEFRIIWAAFKLRHNF